jgi:chorismate synthase
VGAVCAQLLAAFGVRLGSLVLAIGSVAADLDDLVARTRGRPDESASPIEAEFEKLLAAAESSDVRCPDPIAAAAMHDAIQQAARERDTLGGVFAVVALGVPPGLGSHVHWDRRLTSRLLAAVGSVPAVKGVEVGPAFANAGLPGTLVRGEFRLDGDRIARHGSRSGGVEGGISTGEPIVVRAAMKPIATTLAPAPSVDLADRAPRETRYERSDICAVPRAAVVGEAMVAFVLADALLEKIGGDSLDEMLPRFASLRGARLDDLTMDASSWRFGYDEPLEPT